MSSRILGWTPSARQGSARGGCGRLRLAAAHPDLWPQARPLPDDARLPGPAPRRGRPGAPLDEEFEVGAFDAEPGKKGFSATNVLAFARKRLVSGKATVQFVTDRPPTFVGVDPYNKRIDRNSDDNLSTVTVK